MLKIIPVSAPIAATAEMELNSAAGGPAGVVYGAQVPTTNTAATFLQQHQKQEEAAAEPEEFNVFRDYFGLINLVKSFANVPDDLISPTSDYSFEFEGEMRERRDSLGSAGSEFSSSNSAESIEVADIYYTAYGNGNVGILGMKQAFMDHGREDMMSVGTSNGLPASLLMEHKIITSAAAKKPQVCVVVSS